MRVGRSVLGIDAAWTLGQPSGVALVGEQDGEWRLIACSPSYAHFHAMAGGETGIPVRSMSARPDAPALIDSARRLSGRAPDLTIIDMPLATTPITCRRTADDEVSRAYGGRKCSTHTPNPQRPGAISDGLTAAFTEAGYSLCTRTVHVPGLMEVYPHPALLELIGAPERVPYKAGNIRKYWPQFTVAERKLELLKVWARIIEALDDVVAGVANALPLPADNSPRAVLKAYEDQVDAVICAWVGIEALNGRAVPFGDGDAAIWIPTARQSEPRSTRT